jgi:D-alanyl-D-alanine dipeptidase
MKLIANNVTILFFLLLSTFPVQASEQLLLVVARDMDRSEGVLQRYSLQKGRWQRVGTEIPVNLGRNGLAWGEGNGTLPHPASDPRKREGDGRAPAGVFGLGPVFGYAARYATAMPYLQATEDLICVDDVNASTYNRILPVAEAGSIRSFEWMRRKDVLYRIGAVVRHNTEREPGKGSCKTGSP